MSPEEHRRIKDLFQRAEELPPSEREAFLAGVAREDEGLLPEVRRLLQVAGETPEGFLAPSADTHAVPRPIFVGQHLGPYEILAPLAAGGMGEVWRARDMRLGRDVAVKVLPPEHDLHPDRRARFEREARAVAALSHPNIVALYDLGRSGGLAYAVSELLEGQTLRERLQQSALPVDKALECAIQIARALAAAHEKGIVHRDLKPDNVFLTADGQVKLLDFGIASWRESEDSSLDSHPGMVVGTPSYMAPEQVRGQRADHRSDLFAFGCVLYEMLSGRRAFQGEAAAETWRAVLEEEPPPLPGMDEAVRRITRHCLEKNPEERFQSARDLAFHLEAAMKERRHLSAGWSGRKILGAGVVVAAVAVAASIGLSRRWAAPAEPNASRPSRLMLAVLPFESIGGDPEQERFADGMTEEMITVLGRVGGDRLGIIARTSAMQFKGQEATVETIGRRLGVEYVIEGSVRRQDERVRVTAKLIQVSDQTQLWSDSFDGSLKDVLALQGDVARRIAGALSVELRPGFRLAGGPRATDPRAYDAYLAGRVSFYRATEQGWRKAIDYYEEAVAREPDFALAHAAIASGYTAWALWGTTPPADARARATAAVARARELDPDLAEVHSTLAVIRMFFEWDWEEAEREFRRAMALNPSDGEVYHWYAHYLLFRGRPAEGVDAFTEARRFDPLSSFHRGCLGGHYVATGDLDRAEPLLRGVLEQAPESPLAHHFLGWLHERRGRTKEAVASWEEAARISDIPNLLATLAYGYARAGRTADARRVQEELERRASRGYVAALDRAKVYAGLGQRDQAFVWLEKSYRDHDAWLAALRLEPGFDSLRDDPRFPALLRRIGVAP